MLVIWLAPLVGAVFAMMKSNQACFEEQVVSEGAQRRNLEVWNLAYLNEGIVEEDIADGDGE